ncbi:GGDEF domain-containing protein [Catenovulum sp. SM1970]|uniref:GGDEF domain-containing protein n=1 Tax=Marinifaba aquimaris TaxID=2741323 RepID=UPI00157496F0|nr:GGDEF domain-containing protein [Marinifaba aquimaris]NTS77069.1 GGDEF domain-containing protein [Marinifaba aquimaris]
MKYKYQLVLIGCSFVFFLFTASITPILTPDDYFELTSEVVMLLACIAVMFYIENLNFPKVYWILFFGASLSYLGFFFDFAEEFIGEGVYFRSDVEDTLQTTGFVLLCIGIQTWIGVHRQVLRELKKLAKTDQLTGLLNRHAFYHLIDNEPDVPEKPTYLLMDIDHFKRFNDDHGHDLGDKMLAKVAQCLSKQLSSDNALVRWGGEEFLVYIKDFDLTSATQLAEKLRESIEKLQVNFKGQSFKCTMSVGVHMGNDKVSLEENISCADQALYQAKANGRNRVELYNAMMA